MGGINVYRTDEEKIHNVVDKQFTENWKQKQEEEPTTGSKRKESTVL